MKNKRALIVMAVAILFGLAAVVFASRWLLTQPGGANGRIVVANADISLGQRLAPDMFKLADWPADSVPKGAFTDPQKLGGRVLKSNLLAGEPINEAKLAPAGRDVHKLATAMDTHWRDVYALADLIAQRLEMWRVARVWGHGAALRAAGACVPQIWKSRVLREFMHGMNLLR